MNDREEPIYIKYQAVEHETDKALLVLIQGKNVWIPRSQIIDQDDEILAIPRWLAEAKDLEDDFR